MILIARRRWAMGGTRFNARGIDDEGNVANHCEVEQLVLRHSIYGVGNQVSDTESKISET